MTKTQQAVYDVLDERGPLPDHVLVPIVQHVVGFHASSSSIRSRRAELYDLGKVDVVYHVKMPSGRKAAVWAVV